MILKRIWLISLVIFIPFYLFPEIKISKPVLLVWSKEPLRYREINIIPNQVWLNDSDRYSSLGREYRQKELLEKGILPLKWRGGKSYNSKFKTAEELADYWGSAYSQGYVGIAIDEIGSKKKNDNTFDAEAITILRKTYPSLIVAVWHAGLLTEELASAYRTGADIVMLENYSGGDLGFKLAAGINVYLARKYKIINKCIFAIGINDNASEEKQKIQGRWANSGDRVESRFRWIRKHAPEMPGIAVFAPDGSEELLEITEKLFIKYFKE